MTRTELCELEAAMRGLLPVLQDPEADGERVRDAWARCEHHAGTLRALTGEIADADEDERRELVTALESLVRLNAIARESVGAQLRRMSGAIGRARKTERELRYYMTKAHSGGSCDVSG